MSKENKRNLSNFIWSLVLVLSCESNAQTVDQVNTERKQVTISKLPAGTRVGDQFLYSYSDKSQCAVEVLVIKGDSALGAAKQCSRLNEMRVGQALEKMKFSREESRAAETNLSDQSGREAWYSYWAIGGNWHHLDSGPLSNYRINSSFQGGINSMDLLGVYFPWESISGLISGGVLNIQSSRNDGTSNARLLTSETLFSFSNMYFFKGVIGRGLFLRGDLGYSRLFYDWNNPSSPSEKKEESTTSLGLIVGIGGSVPISSSTKILISFNYRTALGSAFNIPVSFVSVGALF